MPTPCSLQIARGGTLEAAYTLAHESCDVRDDVMARAGFRASTLDRVLLTNERLSWPGSTYPNFSKISVLVGSLCKVTVQRTLEK